MSEEKGTIAYIFEDFFDVDLVCGPENAAVTDVQEMLKVAMQKYDPTFVSRVKPGDVLVAGRAFGYGHPHPQAMLVMRHLGIVTVVAKSFARVFFKNELSAGMRLLPCAALPDDLEVGETLGHDLDAWTITRHKDGKVYQLDPIPDIEREMIRCGGIAKYFQQQA